MCILLSYRSLLLLFFKNSGCPPYREIAALVLGCFSTASWKLEVLLQLVHLEVT